MSSRCVRRHPGYDLLAVLDEDQAVTVGQEIVVCAVEEVFHVRSFENARWLRPVIVIHGSDCDFRNGVSVFCSARGSNQLVN